MDDIDLIRSFAILNRAYLNRFSAAMESEGVSYSEGIFVANIGYNPGTSQDKLAQDLVFDRAIVARTVKRLEEKGFVLSERTNVNRRGARLRLTRSGESLYRIIKEFNDEWVGLVMSDLPPKDLLRFRESLERMVIKARRSMN